VKPWQAWTVTVCVVIMCAIHLLIVANLFYAANMFDEMTQELTRDFDADLRKEVEKARKPSSTWIPKPPSGKVELNPPQR